MPGYRLIFGSLAMLIWMYGLIAWPNIAKGDRQDRFDQPQKVQRLIALAFSDSSPEEQRWVSQQLEQELTASLRNPSQYFEQ